MASLFISYSSRDERAATGLQAWLREHDHDVILRPRTKKQEQGAFEDKKSGLQTDIEGVDQVLFLVTPFWQASKLCQWEMVIAKTADMPLVALLEAPSGAELSSKVFVIDMTKNREEGLVRLREELEKNDRGATREKRLTDDEDRADMVLQGAVIADHEPRTPGSGDGAGGRAKKPVRPAKRRQQGVNRTLKILREGIRWSALPAWFTQMFKLPVAGTRVRAQNTLSSLRKTFSFKLPGFGVLAKRATAWVFHDKVRMAGAGFIAFVVATTLIGFLSDRTIGGKDAMRQELSDVKKRQSLLLSRVSNHLRDTGDEETALLLALEALEEAQATDDLQKARDALYSSWIKMQKTLVFRGHDNHVSGAVISPDGRYILSSSWDKTARVWKISTKKQVLVLRQHDGFVNSASYNPEQSLIVTAALDNIARLYNARSGKLIRTLKGHSDDLASAIFSSDGRRILTASGDQTARIWDVAGGKSLKTFLGHKEGLEYAGFSPDGRRIVTASTDKIARIIDVESTDRLASLEGHTGGVRSAVFSPRGDLIATASEDKTIRLWGARSGVLQRVLKGHKWAVLSASFSADGKRLVSASKDNTARVWDVETGRLLLVLRGHTGIVSQARFSPDGRMIVTSSGDGTIRLWPLASSDKDLVKRARRIATKCLSIEQRKKYFLGTVAPEWCVRLKKKPFDKKGR